VRRPTRALLLLLAALGCARAPEAPAPTVLASGAWRLELAPSADRLDLIGPAGAVLRLPPDAFRLATVRTIDPDASYDPYWLLVDDHPLRPEPPPDLVWRAPSAARLVSASAAALELALTYGDLGEARVAITAGADGAWRLDWTAEALALPVVELALGLGVAPDEGLYGLGEWPDGPEHRGKLRAMQLEPDLRIESATEENHAPIPFLIGTRGWAVFVESERAGVFDVARAAPDRVDAVFAEARLSVHLFADARPLDLTRRYHEVTGRPRLPARWATGPLIWRDESRDQAEVMEDVETIRRLDLATSAIWIDRPYATAVNTFDFEPRLYPDPAAMIAHAHAHGLRMALWHTPYVAPDAEPIRARAEAESWFVPVVGFTANNWSDPIDLTRPAVFDAWQALIRRYTALGVEGFKLDYGEDVVVGASGARGVWRFGDGSDERTMHRGYTLLYHRVYAETLPEDGGFLLTRTARWGDQVNGPILWPGDLDATMTRYRERFVPRGRDREVTGVGGLPAGLAMGLSLGPSGFAFYGADTGGYRHSPPDRETWLRWVQASAASVVMQVGDSSSQPPWLFTAENGRDEPALDLYRAYARLHLRLWPYLWSFAVTWPEDGRAIQRPLGFVHPELGVHPDDVFLLGDALLAAPVVDRDARTKRLHLPAGRWWRWPTGAPGAELGAEAVLVGPGEVTVPAPLESLPLFLRAGGIVPLLRPTIDTLSPVTVAGIESYADDPGRLWIRLHPGPASSFALFDGGRIEQSGDATGVEGAFTPGAELVAGAVVEVVGLDAPRGEVQVDGATVTASVSAGVLSFALPAGAHRFSAR
jgi:alpha-D-xyloside xylohydrolase